MHWNISMKYNEIHSCIGMHLELGRHIEYALINHSRLNAFLDQQTCVRRGMHHHKGLRYISWLLIRAKTTSSISVSYAPMYKAICYLSKVRLMWWWLIQFSNRSSIPHASSLYFHFMRSTTSTCVQTTQSMLTCPHCLLHQAWYNAQMPNQIVYPAWAELPHVLWYMLSLGESVEWSQEGCKGHCSHPSALQKQ